MVHVSDLDGDVEPLRDAREDVEQAGRIRAARETNQNRVPRREHVVSFDGAENGLDKREAGPP